MPISKANSQNLSYNEFYEQSLKKQAEEQIRLQKRLEAKQIEAKRKVEQRSRIKRAPRKVSTGKVILSARERKPITGVTQKDIDKSNLKLQQLAEEQQAELDTKAESEYTSAIEAKPVYDETQDYNKYIGDINTWAETYSKPLGRGEERFEQTQQLFEDINKEREDRIKQKQREEIFSVTNTGFSKEDLLKGDTATYVQKEVNDIRQEKKYEVWGSSKGSNTYHKLQNYKTKKEAEDSLKYWTHGSGGKVKEITFDVNYGKKTITEIKGEGNYVKEYDKDGNLTKITERPKEYTSNTGYSKQNQKKKKKTYIPYEAHFDKNGNMTKEIKRDIRKKGYDYSNDWGNKTTYVPYEKSVTKYKDGKLIDAVTKEEYKKSSNTSSSGAWSKVTYGENIKFDYDFDKGAVSKKQEFDTTRKSWTATGHSGGSSSYFSYLKKDTDYVQGLVSTYGRPKSKDDSSGYKPFKVEKTDEEKADESAGTQNVVEWDNLYTGKGYSQEKGFYTGEPTKEIPNLTMQEMGQAVFSGEFTKSGDPIYKSLRSQKFGEAYYGSVLTTEGFKFAGIKDRETNTLMQRSLALDDQYSKDYNTAKTNTARLNVQKKYQEDKLKLQQKYKELTPTTLSEKRKKTIIQDILKEGFSPATTANIFFEKNPRKSFFDTASRLEPGVVKAKLAGIKSESRVGQISGFTLGSVKEGADYLLDKGQSPKTIVNSILAGSLGSFINTAEDLKVKPKKIESKPSKVYTTANETPFNISKDLMSFKKETPLLSGDQEKDYTMLESKRKGISDKYFKTESYFEQPFTTISQQPKEKEVLKDKWYVPNWLEFGGLKKETKKYEEAQSKYVSKYFPVKFNLTESSKFQFVDLQKRDQENVKRAWQFLQSGEKITKENIDYVSDTQLGAKYSSKYFQNFQGTADMSPGYKAEQAIADELGVNLDKYRTKQFGKTAVKDVAIVLATGGVGELITIKKATTLGKVITSKPAQYVLGGLYGGSVGFRGYDTYKDFKEGKYEGASYKTLDLGTEVLSFKIGVDWLKSTSGRPYGTMIQKHQQNKFVQAQMQKGVPWQDPRKTLYSPTGKKVLTDKGTYLETVKLKKTKGMFKESKIDYKIPIEDQPLKDVRVKEWQTQLRAKAYDPLADDLIKTYQRLSKSHYKYYSKKGDTNLMPKFKSDYNPLSVGEKRLISLRSKGEIIPSSGATTLHGFGVQSPLPKKISLLVRSQETSSVKGIIKGGITSTKPTTPIKPSTTKGSGSQQTVTKQTGVTNQNYMQSKTFLKPPTNQAQSFKTTPGVKSKNFIGVASTLLLKSDLILGPTGVFTTTTKTRIKPILDVYTGIKTEQDNRRTTKTIVAPILITGQRPEMDLYEETDYYQNIKTTITPDIKELQRVEQSKLQDLDVVPALLFSLGTSLVRPKRTPPSPSKTKTPPPTPPGGFGWSLGGVRGSGVGRRRRKGYSIKMFNVLNLTGNKKKTKKTKKKKGWAFL